VPCVASMLQPFWAALADVGAGKENPHSHPKRGRVLLLPAERGVPTVRVAHSLEWLLVFTRAQRGAISKEYSVEQRRRPFGVTITTDASPWGYGAFVMVFGVCKGWFAEPISEDDIGMFGIKVGEAKFQALLENLALLIAVRCWLPLWKHQRLAVCLRSDSMAALGAWAKERSTNPAINLVTRELSLDCAEGKFTVDRLEHLPGVANTWADALSRQFQPGSSAVIPGCLRHVPRSFPVARRNGWWQLELRPPKCSGGGLAK
jgi:hypothetical protein